MSDADISGRRKALHKSELLCWNLKHICLEGNTRFIHVKGHFGKGGGQTEEPDLGGDGELLAGLQRWNSHD